MDVTVSLGFDPSREEYAGLLWDTPVSQLRTVRFEISDDETIREAFERGASLLIPDLAARLSNEQFHEYGLGMADREGADLPPIFVDELMLLDGHGRVIWGVGDFRSTTFRQLLRAREAGLLPGEPSNLVLMSPQRGGGGVVIDWESLLAVFDALWRVVGAIATVHSAGEAIGWLRRRLGRGRGVLRSNFPSWSSRGAHAHTLERLLYQRQWTTAELAQLLDVAPSDAAALLALFGFTEDDGGRWGLGSDDDAVVLRSLRQAARQAYADATPDRSELANLLVRKLDAATSLREVEIAAEDLPTERTYLPEAPDPVDPADAVVALLAHIAGRVDEIENLLRQRR